MADELTRLRGLTRDLPPKERDSTLAGYALRMHARAQGARRAVALAFVSGVSIGVTFMAFAWWFAGK